VTTSDPRRVSNGRNREEVRCARCNNYINFAVFSTSALVAQAVPGVVTVQNGVLQYTAVSGQTNNVTLTTHPSLLTISDAVDISLGSDPSGA